MALQGGFTLRFGVQRFKDYLASPDTDFLSAARVMLSFLNLLAAHQAQLKAFAELLGHLVEGAMRHPSCNAEWLLGEIGELADQLVVSTAGEASFYPPLNEMRQTRMTALGNILAQSVQLGVDLAARPVQRRAVKLDAIKCKTTPYLVFDGSVSEPFAMAITRGATPPFPESPEPK